MARERNERAAKEREEKITFPMEHPDEIADELMRSNQINAMGDRLFLLALALMIVAEPSEGKSTILVTFVLALGAFSVIRAVQRWSQGNTYWDIARDARIRLRENSEDDQVEG